MFGFGSYIKHLFKQNIKNNIIVEESYEQDLRRKFSISNDKTSFNFLSRGDFWLFYNYTQNLL